MLNVITLDKAKNLISSRLQNHSIITLDLDSAVGKIVAKDIFCSQDLPQFCRSTMDGYAVKSSNLVGASQSVPAAFKLIGKSIMGKKTDLKILDGQCVYVPTGAMLPHGSDAVVMIEHTSKLLDEVFVYTPVKAKENIIEKGEDYKKGSMLLPKGSILTSAKIGVLASAGVSVVPVFKPMTFSLISTGDEIVPSCAQLTGCNIRDINSHMLSAMIKTVGQANSSIIVSDDFDKLVKAIENGLNSSDIIVISGGSSVGYSDYTKKAILRFTDDLFIEGIALKPGKPTMAASVDNKLILGLPGNPMAAHVAFSKVFIDGVYDAFGIKEQKKLFARAKTNFPSASGRATVMPLKLEESAQGYLASPLFYKSGLINVLSKADGYTIIPDNEEGILADTLLEVFPI
ncbi:MAG: molybdopterin molybdotransferase MoeA [Clostridiales bacterium]|nr:molybdopterin molybdotransferase MoeA [Clostridiales bacterium]